MGWFTTWIRPFKMTNYKYDELWRVDYDTVLDYDDDIIRLLTC